jgi:UDP-N-acetylmuramate: L-alanyl-gamma-D-glutamyl-meso-diaminopimelate ligase
MRIHLTAIGGSAMHNLALALQKIGHTVSGSDDEIYDPARSRLEAAGLLPEKEGWDPNRITADLDLLIVGMHARPDNPELLKAQEIGVPLHSYPSFLYSHSKDKQRVVVGGSHGKTTTTSIIMHVLQNSNTSFDYLVGAQLSGFDHMVQLSDAPVIVLEGDEYLSSPLDRRSKFLHYRPQLAVLTGIAWDHINVFPTFESYLDTFRQFIQSMPPESTLFYYAGDAHLQDLVQEAPANVRCIGYDAVPEGEQDQTVLLNGEVVSWSLIGKHNRENLQAAWLVCQALGVSEPDFAAALEQFAGPALRLEKRYETDQMTVFRDYAHAPSKLQATLEGLRKHYPHRRVTAIFELHTFSSLNRDFLPHYAGTMQTADQAVVFYLPHTLQMKRMPNLDPAFIREAFDQPNLIVIDNTEDLKKWLLTQQEEGGIFAMMSSGNFGQLGEWYED